MFVLAKEATWIWPVQVRVPQEGGFVTQTFKARWRLVEKARREELVRTEAGVDELIRLSVTELLDIRDADGAPVPHSDALLETLLALPWCRRGLAEAMIEAWSGSPSAAAAGN